MIGIATSAILLPLLFNHASIRKAEMNCTNNMRSVGLAIMNYHAAFKRYPSPDFGGHSWRIRCLPFVMASPMYSEYRFDERWDSPNNITIDTRPFQSKKIVDENADVPMEVLGVPYPYPCTHSDDAHFASYLMLVGDNAFGKPNGWRSDSEVLDDPKSTIAVAETIATTNHWLSPRDLDVATMSFTVNDGPNSISSRHPRGPAVLFCDWAIYRLNPAIDEDTLKAMVTIDGGEELSRELLVERGMLLAP
ncbi:DUF1559 family PulG-like putative transporter [Roseiconus lacunae]|uniref:DUF1559 family PulG-like putative transporter n=1 Tax=Roseiconus lacunae TaxID=2605694 RepID=UPI0036F43CD2